MIDRWIHRSGPGTTGEIPAAGSLARTILTADPVRRFMHAFDLPIPCDVPCGGECTRALFAATLELDARSGLERWELPVVELTPRAAATLHDVVDYLGMLRGTDPLGEASDAVVIPGAAGATARRRVEYAARFAPEVGAREVFVLSGGRVITQQERSRIRAWAPDAKTEHDLMAAASGALLCAGEATVRSMRVEGHGRRATTEDTGRTLFPVAVAAGHRRFLVVTTSLFVPYQHLVFLRCAHRFALTIETVGVPVADTGSRTDDAALLDAVAAVLREASRLLVRHA